MNKWEVEIDAKPVINAEHACGESCFLLLDFSLMTRPSVSTQFRVKNQGDCCSYTC